MRLTIRNICQKHYLITFFLVLFVSWCFIRCSNKESHNNSDQIAYHLDSIFIPITNTQLNSYYIFDYNSKENIFIGYNASLHLFDIFSFSTREFIKQISLKNEGPTGIGSVEGVHFWNKDSIFIQEYGHIKIIDIQGNFVVDHNYITQISKEYSYTGNPVSNQHIRLNYQPSTQSVFLYSIRENYQNKNQSPLISYSLLDHTFKQYPIEFPSYYYKKDSNLGHLNYTNAKILNDSIILYNHLFDNTIYRLSTSANYTQSFIPTQSRQHSKFLMNSKFQEEWEVHALENTHYFEILHDPFRDLYYQLIWEDIPYKKNKNQVNSFQDKPLRLKVYNLDFQQIADIPLKSYTYQPFTWFISKEGLMISNTHPQNPQMSENYLSFHIYSFHGK